MFGSVAINAYLPDGDIDFSLLGGPAAGAEVKRPLKELWTQQLAGVLNREQRDPHAELRVGQVQVVNAEVRCAPRPPVKSEPSVKSWSQSTSMEPSNVQTIERAHATFVIAAAQRVHLVSPHRPHPTAPRQLGPAAGAPLGRRAKGHLAGSSRRENSNNLMIQ